MRFSITVMACAAWMAMLVPASAQVPLEGFIVARDNCPATPAIRKPGNPGNVALMPEKAYRLIGENKSGGSHYLVEIPGADPIRRWVVKGCGDWVTMVAPSSPMGSADSAEADDDESMDLADQDTAEPEGASDVASSEPATGGGAHRELLLAISWQPAFCETRPNKPECQSQTENRFDASHFTLHGLWPQPRGVEYCGVSEADKNTDKNGSWDDLDPVELGAATKTALDEAMPGTQSALERHEWIKHGTCYRTDSDEYFADSLAVLGAINASAVRELFAGAIGETLTQSAIRGAFDSAFGAGSGERVRIACKNDGNRRIVTELTIGLIGEITPTPDMGALLAAARSTNGGCDQGIVDAVGEQ